MMMGPEPISRILCRSLRRGTVGGFLRETFGAGEDHSPSRRLGGKPKRAAKLRRRRAGHPRRPRGE